MILLCTVSLTVYSSRLTSHPCGMLLRGTQRADTAMQMMYNIKLNNPTNLQTAIIPPEAYMSNIQQWKEANRIKLNQTRRASLDSAPHTEKNGL